MEEQILAASFKIRAILQRNRGKIVKAGYRSYKSFPKNCCESGIHFLAHYLVAEGLCKPTEIRMPWNNHDGEAKWRGSHGWISLPCGLNIDITADQFRGISEAVIVSGNHPLHRRFIRNEWVSFAEHHRRLTCHDDGESFKKVWELIMADSKKPAPS